MMWRLLFLFVATFTTTASSVEVTNEPCVDTVASLTAHRLPVRDQRKTMRAQFDFGLKAQCFFNGEAKRKALLVALDDFAPPLVLTLLSVPKREAMLAPRVQLLNSEGQEIAVYSFEHFKRRGGQFSLTLFAEETARKGYLLITPDPGLLGQSDTYTAGTRSTIIWGTGTVFGTFSDGREREMKNSFSEQGTLNIEIEPVEARRR